MSVLSLPSELSGYYLLDTTRTRVGFIARHTMSTRVRGRFEEFEGNAYLDGGDPSKSEIWLTIQARSVQTGKPQRDELLSSKFLDADGHPTLTFESTRVEQVEDDVFKVTGDLTIRTVTRAVTVVFTLTGRETGPRGDSRISARGNATIDRNDWGVNWNAMTTAMVSPKVTLDFDVCAVRQP
ncbi:YceI family protein [Streptomyces sp. NPDC096048]|uniref:YceI family protein n=1 Tax=Streptomyces sp. NPDC096048 TaxID=3366072 RepID=UPI0038230902